MFKINLPQSHPPKIKQYILPPLILVILLFQGTFIFVFSREQKQRIDANRKITNQMVQRLLKEEMSHDFEKMSIVMEAIIRDPILMSHLKNQDKEALLTRATPLFERLKKQFKVTHFYFHLPNRINLLRVHKSLKGDFIDRETIKRAEAISQPTAGLEQEPTGNPVLRVVYPWHSDFPQRLDSNLFEAPWQGELVGYLELGIEFEAVLERIHHLLNIDLILSVDKQFLDRRRWENRNKKLGRQSDWDAFPDTVIINQTIKEIPEPLTQAIAQSKINKNYTLEFSDDHRTLEAIFIPLYDPNSQSIGHIVVLQDISDILSTAQQSILSTSLVCTSLGLILVFFFDYLLDRVEKHIVKNTLKLAKTQRQLQEYSETLEFKVAERTQQLNFAKKKSEKASQAKSDFLSAMSHELRTPLNGILGYAQILKRDQSLNPTQKEGLNIIEKSGSYLLSLINDILDLSKIEACKMELYLNEIHFPSFLESVVNLMKIRSSEKDILFKHEVDNNFPTGIKADDKRLRQVLLNLLGNAIKFTDQGYVELNVKTDKLDSESIKICFEIIDTGVGMTPEQISRIFQPFEQVGDIKRRAEGMGLGLAITQQLVQLMGSRLQVKSLPGEGSTFWFETVFSIVATATQLSVKIPGQIVGYHGKERTILIVDDKEENRLVLQSMLEPLGFKIVLGEDGQQEVELTQKIQPDLILTDLVMPVKTGFEAIQEIRQLSRFQNLPIIAISASLMNSDQDQSRIVGCNDFLPKPIDEKKLLTLLEKYLQLEWIYEQLEEIDLGSSEIMEIPPDNEISKFHELAKRGLFSQIKQQAETLKQKDTKYKIFTTKLTQMAEELKGKQLQKFLEDYQTSAVIPPFEELEVLYKLALLGSMRKIQERATYLENLNQNYVPFAQQLKSLAQDFQDEEIVNLIEKYIHNN